MTYHIRFPLILSLLGLLLASCSTDKFSAPPQSFGNLNQIIVVADTELWEGPVGDSLRYHLAPAYPVLPQPEPVFDLRHFTQEEIDANSDRLRFRNMLYLAEVSETGYGTAFTMKEVVGAENLRKMADSPEKSDIKVSRNRWAVGQTVLFFYATDMETLIAAIRAKSASIARTFGKKDHEMLENRVYMSGRNGKAMREIKEAFGISLPVPGGYEVALHDKEKDFIWLRMLKPNSHIHTNIMVSRLPYGEQGLPDAQKVKELRNTLTQQYVVSGEVEDSYMRVDDVHLPLYSEAAEIDGQAAIQIRGIWQMSAPADMMGGAFVSYAIPDNSGNGLILLDGFAYAPGEKKRDLIQGLNLVLQGTQME